MTYEEKELVERLARRVWVLEDHPWDAAKKWEDLLETIREDHRKLAREMVRIVREYDAEKDQEMAEYNGMVAEEAAHEAAAMRGHEDEEREPDA